MTDRKCATCKHWPGKVVTDFERCQYPVPEWVEHLLDVDDWSAGTLGTWGDSCRCWAARTEGENNALQAENERLRAIRDKLIDYDEHMTNAWYNQEDARIDPICYDYVEVEERFAEEALKEAIRLAKSAGEA